MINKKGNILWLTALLLTVLIVAFTGRTQVNAEVTTMEKKLYTLEYPSWMAAQGLSKGIYHDRQDLGVVLPKGATIEIRQKNPDFTENLQIQLLNDDSQTETTTTFGKSWVTVTAGSESVPFINTSFTKEAPVVEYRVSESALSLPVFNEGDKESDFFDKWDGNKSGFGLVRNKYIQILVPARDKSYLKKMDDFSSINDLSAYYTKIFETYNEMEGLSFTPERATDKNIPNRYFAKANKNGSGSAYYSSSHTASNSNSVTAFWLKPGWGGLHEIGHGYQGGFIDDPTFSSREVWNNLFAIGLQEKLYGSDYYYKSTMYGGDPTLKETEFEDNVYNTKKPANKWDVGKKLYLLTLIKDKAGDKAFTHFNQSYRAEANAQTLPENNLLFDYFSKYFGEVSNFDFTPFVELVQGTISKDQKVANLYSGYKAVYPLASLVSGDNLTKARKDIKLDSKWGLVHTKQLEKLKLTNNATIQFTMDDFAQIKGKSLRIKDGLDVIREVKITSPTITVKSLPLGIYSLDIPTGINTFYEPSTNYLAVSDRENNTNISMERLQSSEVATEQMIFKGLSGRTFANVVVDPEAEKLTLNVIYGAPHSYFENAYASIEVLNEKGESVFTNVMKGQSAKTGTFETTIKPGYTINVMHQEPGRFEIQGAATGLSQYKVNQSFKVSQYGLINDATDVTEQDALASFKAKLVSLASKLNSNSKIKDEDYATPKNNLKKAITYLPEADADRIKYQHDYENLLVAKHDGSQNLVSGEKFRFEIQGLGGSHFANIDLDLATSKAEVTNVARKVHAYFNDVYTSVKIYTPKGKQVLSKDYIGNQTTPASKEEVNIGVGYYVTITHQEPSRLVFTNTETKEIYDSYHTELTYVITPDGLKKVAASTIPTPNANELDGNKFKFNLEGLSYWNFASLELDLQNKNAKIQQNAGSPHVYFTDTYAAIKIRDSRGKVIYTRDYNGRDSAPNSLDNIKIGTGYYITVMHREYDARLKIWNVDTNEKYLVTKQTNTYKITEDGLLKVTEDSIPTVSSNDIDGKIFKYAFLGFEYRNFANLTIDLASKQLELSTNAGIPHRNFNKTTPYASIQVKDKDGSEVYQFNMIGDEELGSILKKMPIEEGYYLIITHLEASNRLNLTVDNAAQGTMAKQNAYEITENGLTKKNLDEIPVPNRYTKQKLYSSELDFIFKGFSDRQFAALHLDTEKNMLHLEFSAIQPHLNFSNAYASIEVKDTNGKTVFTKDIIGNVIQNAETLDIPLQYGYTIQINHQENGRLSIMDSNTKKIYKASSHNTFLVVANGLINQ
ncbi:putative mucin/carbohydrate-binding domain-containing protein [Listeria booriae]|uniref:putative mucin/carbohydrate-binding domain-containing protein n=1 Tax=Listeria booriae TaxID=1552123 RepID=UPI00162923A5|nr:putative mucin/carbohydrate-binding domain-containing protein [Listeria booriae]MBC1984953.1 enhancing factor (viral) [Listeria booriae]